MQCVIGAKVTSYKENRLKSLQISACLGF